MYFPKKIFIKFFFVIFYTILICIISLFLGSSNQEAKRYSIFDCISDIESKNETALKDINHRAAVVDICYQTIYRNDSLDDFKIRKLKFIQQKYDEVVMLWMVVIITISGVLLAALQLAASYKLASIGKQIFGSESVEISVEREKLVFKSSVTGLAILIISFAFFLVFVMEIYTIREIKTEQVLAQPIVGAGISANSPPGDSGYGSVPISKPATSQTP